ncbi:MULTISPECIES: hypothetical protein [Chryseobacterium]|uniref:MBG domain-containing protein n=1 Tax=Chryseobacterium taihuense TaxID=1141221 RepID=A0A4U8W7N5_9FLAO|nr:MULTISPECIES: hypothetical protein [Chryseobacterium]QQV01304.1 hypothetical protein I6I61_09300 [Chryseobacterium sp. FDAARGOS 1104]VFB02102.1 Uncharacterised protein [Chryseobacterium taihuense]
MKKLYATIGLSLATLLSAQVPQAFSYQTIAFNAAGAPIANGNVALKISILENSATGTVLYSETHNKTTNAKGLVNLNIGQGTATTGNFGAINWGTNAKFVKVEMDPNGGSNYTNVGVNQLMSVPYAQVSKTIVTGAGQGITLTSPNGTAYILGVNDSGNLSLPTSSSSNSSLPGNFYLYGSYNSYNASTAELLRNTNYNSTKIGYKYLPANIQLKLIASQASSAQVYGVDSNGYIIANGNALNVTSNGFYRIYTTQTIYPSTSLIAENISPQIWLDSNSSAITVSSITYNTSTNKFSVNINGATSSNFSGLKINLPGYGIPSEALGDNLSDGNFDVNGSLIMLPNLTSTPKNYKIEFSINFDATGTYTITQI